MNLYGLAYGLLGAEFVSLELQEFCLTTHFNHEGVSIDY